MARHSHSPKLWSQIEWKNCYSLYEATQLYESDDSLTFNEFREKVLSDENFARINFLRPHMNNEGYNPWGNSQSINYYLIKRSPDLTNRGVIVKLNTETKGYSESNLNRTPSSCKLIPGDIIYVHEKGYGIYGRGRVTKVMQPEIFKTSDEVIESFINKNEPVYCFNLLRKLKEAKSENPTSQLYFHEYFVDLEILKKVVPLEGPLVGLKGIRGFSQIKNMQLVNYIEHPSLDTNIKLNECIPNALKQKLYSLFNQKYKVSTFIDIDHFVPKSLGGPGNIEENLVPIGFSLNRYKGNSVPLGLFQMATKYPDLKKHTQGVTDKEMFLNGCVKVFSLHLK